MSLSIKYQSLRGAEMESQLEAMGQLRISVFKDWPYLYEGSLQYERRYLKKYMISQKSLAYLAFDRDQLIGATTAIVLSDEDQSIQKPLAEIHLLPSETVYFGESILLSDYRGIGIGKRFMSERLRFAESLPGIKHAAFCSVIRSEDDPRRPLNYKPLDEFWKKQGFQPISGVTAEMSWCEVGDLAETKKQLQFWVKSLV